MNAVRFNNRFQDKINILHENRGEMSLKEYHEYSKENDPRYIGFLLGGEHINDYGQGMTEEDKELLAEFESIL